MTELSDIVAPQPDSPTQVSRRDDWLWAGLIVLLTLVVYQPAIRGAFLWDDDRHVSQNRTLRSAEGLINIWLHPSTGRTYETGYVTPQYYPLTHTTYWLEYHLWGLNTVGYHLINILLHAGAALILWQILKLLKVPGAWVAAAIFAVHPIQAESVAWITERKNVLSGIFFVGSIYAHLRFVINRDGGRKEWAWYAAALVMFACAVLSKTVAAVMPAVMVVILWWRFRKIQLSWLLGLIPFAVFGAMLGRQTAWMERHIVGATGPEWDLSFVDRLQIAGHAFWFYLGKLFWPANLTFTYTRWPLGQGWGYVILAAVALGIAGVFWIIGRRGRAVGAGLLAYAVMLFPAMGFFDVYPMRFSFVADHFQYLAGMAVITTVVGVIASRVWRGEHARGAQAVQGFAGAVIVVLAVMTWRQAGIYASPITLWRDTVAKNPDAWMAQYNLGTELALQAINERGMGDAESATKSFDEAMGCFAKCVAIRPEHAKAYANWGVALMETGKPSEAEEKLKHAIELDPSADEAHVSLGLLYTRSNRPAPAQAEFEKVIALNPKSWLGYLNLGKLLAAKGKLPEAEQALSKEVEIQPNDAEGNYQLGLVFARELKAPGALMHVGKACELAPNNPDMLATLGYLWFEAGHPQESYEAFRRALTIDPNNARALEGAKKLIKSVADARRAATTRSTTTRSTTTRTTSKPAK